jgi:hypothetical protein
MTFKNLIDSKCFSVSSGFSPFHFKVFLASAYSKTVTARTPSSQPCLLTEVIFNVNEFRSETVLRPFVAAELLLYLASV